MRELVKTCFGVHVPSRTREYMAIVFPIPEIMAKIPAQVRKYKMILPRRDGCDELAGTSELKILAWVIITPIIARPRRMSRETSRFMQNPFWQYFEFHKIECNFLLCIILNFFHCF